MSQRRCKWGTIPVFRWEWNCPWQATELGNYLSCMETRLILLMVPWYCCLGYRLNDSKTWVLKSFEMLQLVVSIQKHFLEHSARLACPFHLVSSMLTSRCCRCKDIRKLLTWVHIQIQAYCMRGRYAGPSLAYTELTQNSYIPMRPAYWPWMGNAPVLPPDLNTWTFAWGQPILFRLLSSPSREEIGPGDPEQRAEVSTG